jgi:hypothetical protein
MTLRWMYDASTPPKNPPHWHVAAGYIGGDTPNVWTLAEWKAQPAPYLLPIWTASNRDDTAADAGEDAWGIIKKLSSLGVPGPVTVALDIETAVYSTYLLALNDFLAPHKLMTYGSLSSLVRNSATSGGRWAGDWTDNINIATDLIGTDDIVALQYANSQMTGHPWDHSLIEDTVLLWKNPGNG